MRVCTFVCKKKMEKNSIWVKITFFEKNLSWRISYVTPLTFLTNPFWSSSTNEPIFSVYDKQKLIRPTMTEKFWFALGLHSSEGPLKANTLDHGQSLLLTRPIETHFSHSTRVCTILAFIDVLAFSIYLLKAIGTAAYTRFGSEIWSFSPVAFVGSYSINAVLAEWTVMIGVRMITFVDVNTAFIVNFLVARKALASCVSNWVIRLAKGPHLIGIIRTTTQIGTGHSITNTLVSFQMIPIIALAGKLCSNFE